MRAALLLIAMAGCAVETEPATQAVLLSGLVAPSPYYGQSIAVPCADTADAGHFDRLECTVITDALWQWQQIGARPVMNVNGEDGDFTFKPADAQLDDPALGITAHTFIVETREVVAAYSRIDRKKISDWAAGMYSYETAFASVVLHELGHDLGLGPPADEVGHINDCGDPMNASTDWALAGCPHLEAAFDGSRLTIKDRQAFEAAHGLVGVQ